MARFLKIRNRESRFLLPEELWIGKSERELRFLGIGIVPPLVGVDAEVTASKIFPFPVTQASLGRAAYPLYLGAPLSKWLVMAYGNESSIKHAPICLGTKPPDRLHFRDWIMSSTECMVEMDIPLIAAEIFPSFSQNFKSKFSLGWVVATVKITTRYSEVHSKVRKHSARARPATCHPVSVGNFNTTGATAFVDLRPASRQVVDSRPRSSIQTQWHRCCSRGCWPCKCWHRWHTCISGRVWFSYLTRSSKHNSM